MIKHSQVFPGGIEKNVLDGEHTLATYLDIFSICLIYYFLLSGDLIVQYCLLTSWSKRILDSDWLDKQGVKKVGNIAT